MARRVPFIQHVAFPMALDLFFNVNRARIRVSVHPTGYSLSCDIGRFAFACSTAHKFNAWSAFNLQVQWDWERDYVWNGTSTAMHAHDA